LKKRSVEEGLEAAFERKPREVQSDGAFEARLITLACSAVPEGFGRWTVRLLVGKTVEPKFVSSMSQMTI
jgi:hypothetical protein